MKKLFPLSLFAIIHCIAFANVRNVPGTYSTIQAALNACVTGDTVMVQPGTYVENINWPNVADIRMYSAGDTSNTIIDGNAAGTVISISTSLADTNTVIKGFKITNGSGNSTFVYGAGVSVSSGGVKLKKCLLSDNLPGGNNTLYTFGGALYVSGNGSLLDGVMIRNNSSNSGGYAFGGGIYVDVSTPLWMRNSVVANNLITGANYCFGGGIYSEGDLTITNSTVKFNRTSSGGYNFGGGINMSAGTGSLTNVSIRENTVGGNANYFWGAGLYMEGGATATLTNVLVGDNAINPGGFVCGGGGIYTTGNGTALTGMHVTVAGNYRQNNGNINGTGLCAETSSSITLTNSISYNNNSGAEVSSSSSTITITYSDVRGGYTGTGNINSTPIFMGPIDFHLNAGSPCAGAGTVSGSPSFDLDNAARPQPVATNPDMGSYEVDQTTVGIFSLPNEISFSVYPSPFNLSTTISYHLPSAVLVRMELIDLEGKLVMNISEGMENEGTHTRTLDASALAAGTYLCRMRAGDEVKILKVVKF